MEGAIRSILEINIGSVSIIAPLVSVMYFGYRKYRGFKDGIKNPQVTKESVLKSSKEIFKLTLGAVVVLVCADIALHSPIINTIGGCILVEFITKDLQSLAYLKHFNLLL